MTTAHALPRTAREVRLATVPDGLPRPDDFAVTDAPLPEPGPGHVLVRNRHFAVMSGLRTLLGGHETTSSFPSIQPGDPLFGAAVGEVVTAPDEGRFRPGDTVVHFYGWREYAAVAETDCVPTDPRFPAVAAHLAPSSPAYGALTRLAAVRDGDTVLVTGATGGVGSLAGQIARLLGAGRVIGTTRSPHKVARLTQELGYDAVLVPGEVPLAEQLAEAVPGGLDVVVDLVGGGQLRAALDVAAPGARIALVGSLTGQLDPRHDGSTSPVEIDTFPMITLGVSMAGYRYPDHLDVEAEWTDRFAEWLSTGRIVFPHVRIAGIEAAPRALEEMMAGRHLGTVIVDLED